MALTGVLRPGHAQLRVLDLEEGVRHYRDVLGMVETGRDASGRVYLKCWDERDHSSLILREADRAGIDFFAFKVLDDATLVSLTDRLIAHGLTVDEVEPGADPGVGRRIGFTIPSGHRIELFAEMEFSDRGPQVINPNVWPEEPKGMAVTRFDHALLYGPNIPDVVEIFTEVLDFKVAERADLGNGAQAVWLTTSNKAHDIAFVEIPEPGRFHHVAFYLETVNAVVHAGDIMAYYDIPIDIGPTRHGITRGHTIYFFDPSGNRNEVFAGGYTYYPDNPTRTWNEQELGKAIFYYEKALNERFLGVVT
ncbi:MAG: catechol 2,3-dioxygenase [Gammaproteobacteria bacterium]|nr:catechol 2,3-dioxygenase [Gammaproteobacteria bacterium]